MKAMSIIGIVICAISILASMVAMGAGGEAAVIGGLLLIYSLYFLSLSIVVLVKSIKK